jgi:hypothetical protein
MTNEDNTADGRFSNWTLKTVMKTASSEDRRLSDGSL